jgi:hypothetical protein
VFVQTPLHLEGHDTLAKLVMPAVFLITLLGLVILREMARTALRLDDEDARLRVADLQRPPNLPPARVQDENSSR